jgi:hypothetical protein
MASDLSRYHQLKLSDWHRATRRPDGRLVLSSYELLELLEFLPSEGAFKTAARGGEYSEADVVWRHMASEIGKLRATMHAVHGGERYAPKVFLTLAEMRENTQIAEAAEERREDIFAFADRSPKVSVQRDGDDELAAGVAS